MFLCVKYVPGNNLRCFLGISQHFTITTTLVNCLSLGLINKGSGDIGGCSLLRYSIFSKVCVAVDLQSEHIEIDLHLLCYALIKCILGIL